MSEILTLLKFLCRPSLARGTDLVEQYEESFARTVLGDEGLRTLAFWRGRVALWTILRVLGVSKGDEVIVPACTCEMVPVAVKFTGATCRFVDVGPSGFNADPACIQGAITQQTKAILCQHTYGVPVDLRRIAELAEECGAAVIEDCCQCVYPGDDAGGVGHTGVASFFSTQWTKPFSTGLGGMAAFNDPALYTSAREIRDGFSREGDRQRARSLAAQMLLYKIMVRSSTHARIARVYRWAQKTGLVRGTSTAEEYEGEMPSDYLAGAVNLQASVGIRELRRWGDNVRHRRALTALYIAGLSALGVDVSPLTVGGGSAALWAVPLLVENKAEILAKAEGAGLPIRAWFDGLPLHIAPATAARYDYSPGLCPRSERLFHREIHLVTSPAVTRAQAERALALLRRNARLTSAL